MSVMRTLRPIAIGIGVGLVAGLALLPGSALGASEQGFSVSAVGAGMRVTTKSTADPTGTQFDVSAPLAAAHVSSVPDSSGFASTPHPGDDALSLYYTAQGLLGVPAVPYPASVRSGYPGVAKASSGAPAGYTLSAESSMTTSKASSTAGASSTADLRVGSSSAMTEVKAVAGGGATGLGTTETDSITAGPLSLSRVTSRANAILDSNGGLKLSSAMQLGDVTVAGQRVGLTKDGLTVAGTDIPLPAGQLTDALKPYGVTVSYLAEKKTTEGVTAPGLLITYKDSTQEVTITLGRAQARAVRSADGPGASTEPPFSTDPTAGVRPGDPSVASPRGSSFSGPTAPIGIGTGVPPAPAVGGEPPAVARVLAPESEPPALLGASFRPETFSSGLFYLVFVLAALATVLLGQSMRYLGVRWAN